MEDDNHFNPNRGDSADARTQQYAARAIFILGPSSSGKTTLCDGIARSGFSRADTDTYEMQHTILLAQVAAEEEVLKRIGSSDAILLSDRSAIDPIVYASTSKVPGASDRKQRLLDNSALSAILPFYKTSLFNK
ncbi:hypothetical protein WOLCODRAFT_27953 [Wolfiporia cocos MD-104 SS10]|uniref:NadR/Ttd14 AAA domain-containing protein n=1 Tax=Wolfiporia cocos (strain MD-104) TaxID=742152 RepID=A0A2H3JHN7_WOLCO|nr:hypothetical protein WOLCODRAFT_27953 [Wolfiporia cocos MD-104 SS10]